ncbi:MAG: ATP-binding cassette domain-containing protein [Eisenbergiella massiliensis]
MYTLNTAKMRRNMFFDITLHMKAGQTIGIIGRTGAAKSTLVQLIPVCMMTEGEIRIDGHPVQEYPLRHLRDAIAMVLQKTRFFPEPSGITCGGEGGRHGGRDRRGMQNRLRG